MLVHFHEFMKKAALDHNFMLVLGMDDPNISLLFKNKLKEEFWIIEEGTCPWHIVNNAFGKAFKALKESVVDLDEMVIDFHFFFKYLAARREQYTTCQEITGVTAKMMKKHCLTRWLTLEKVLLKLMEQWENLSEYFIEKFQPFLGSLVQKAFPPRQDMLVSKVICKVKNYRCHRICYFVCPGFSKIHKNFLDQCTIDSLTLPNMPAVVAHCIRKIPEGWSFPAE